MTLLADSMRMSTVPARIVALWNAAATRWNPIVLIIVAWAVLTLPLVFLRGYNSDEGLAVSIARTALEDGYWLNAHMFNVRLIERPTLLSWIIAAISVPFGHVGQVAARLPVVLFLLLGCLLIYSLLRKVAASIPAAVLGAALFLACPLVMRSYAMITADMPLAVLLFLAFVLWWDGCQNGALGLGRWIVVGIVLALAGLMKGPEPIAYFALGIGLFVLGSRSWRQIPGLIAAGMICVLPLAAWYAAVYVSGDEAQWAAFMRLRPAVQLAGPIEESLRLVSETLPAMLLAAVFLVWQSLHRGNLNRPVFFGAIACYAFTASLLVLFWPGGAAARYFFPMVLPLCVLGGLGYDTLGTRRPEIVAPILVLTAGLLVYALAYSAVAVPLMPSPFRHAWIDAARITEQAQAAPAPIYTMGATALNVLPYVPGKILSVTPGEMDLVPGPAWIVAPTEMVETLLSHRPDKLHVVTPLGEHDEWRLLRLDK
jgi:4-amino-4-deoxy-L-arabinose transferase-like glycosyltransferase